MSARTVAILGGGRIGEALRSGLLSSGWRDESEIVVTRRGDDNVAAASGAAVVVIAVKPQDMDGLLAEIGPGLTPQQTVVSVAAAVTTAHVEARIANGVPVVRAMPNAPSTVHEGMAGICAGTHAGEEHLAIAEELLGHLGRVVRVPESLMDAVTAISGSGPAYFALLAEAMIEAGILLGVSREISTTLVVQTMFGTAKQLRDEGMHPVELRESVTSPGGTTIAAIRELEQAGVRAAFLNAIQAAMDRAREARRRMSDVAIEVVDDPARACAERLAAQARDGGSIVLTGGSTPRRAYEIAAELEPDWSRVDVWWGDERCVPPDDEVSNYGMAKEALLDRLAVAPRSVHRMASVDEYARELDGIGTFDLVLLGLGPDGHVASLFPDFPTLDVTDRDVVETPAGHEPFVDRITMTLPRLRGTRELLFLVAGGDKADAVARALAGEPSRDTPGSLVRGETTRAILDSAAAAKLG